MPRDGSWSSGPAGTPQPIVERLHNELKAIMGSADVQQAVNRIGVVPVVSPPLAELPKFIVTEKERWGKVVAAGRAGRDAVSGVSPAAMKRASLLIDRRASKNPAGRNAMRRARLRRWR